MKVLLYQTELNPGNIKGVFHFGIVAAATYLQSNGHEVHLQTLDNPDMDKDQFLSGIETIDPGLIGFSVMTDEWTYITKLASLIKTKFSVPIICGGPHATMAPQQVINYPAIDILCRGEGEYAFKELCDCLEHDKDYRNIENLWVKDGEEIVANPVRPLVENLDDLPFPDTKLVDFGKILAENQNTARFMVGRGCPFECAYCINRGIHDLYRGKGRPVRKRSPEKAVQALKEMVANYPQVVAIGFDDDILSLDKNWLREFGPLYKKEVGLPFSFYMRIEKVDRELLTIIKEAGAAHVDIGVESGDEELRRRVLNRKMSNQQIIDGFKLLDEFGLRTSSLNMVGLPFETPKMIEETIELNQKLNPSRLFATPFQPYPGTKLRELCLEKGWLSEDEPFLNRDESILNLPTLTKDEITEAAHRLNHVGYVLSARKHPSGLYDFLAHFTEADIEKANEKDVEVTLFGIRSELVLKTTPPARVTYKLNLPPGVALKFDIGMPEEIYNDPGDGVMFVVEIENGNDFGCKERIFARYLNPRRNKNHRGWHEFELPLGQYQGQEVRLSFVTRPGPWLKQCLRLAGWRYPRLIHQTSPSRLKQPTVNE